MAGVRTRFKDEDCMPVPSKRNHHGSWVIWLKSSLMGDWAIKPHHRKSNSSVFITGPYQCHLLSRKNRVCSGNQTPRSSPLGNHPLLNQGGLSMVWTFAPSNSVSWITYSRGGQLPHREDTQAALWRGPWRKELGPSANSWHWLASQFRSGSSSPSWDFWWVQPQPTSDCNFMREILSQIQPAKVLTSSWPTWILKNHKWLFLF